MVKASIEDRTTTHINAEAHLLRTKIVEAKTFQIPSLLLRV